MPAQETIRRVGRDKQQSKSPSTQAGEFVREEMKDVRRGVHGARSTRQAIAIGLSKARRAGVDLPPGKKAPSTRSTKKRSSGRSSRKRANSSLRALRREGSASSSPALPFRKSQRPQARFREPPPKLPKPGLTIDRSAAVKNLRKNFVTREGTTSQLAAKPSRCHSEPSQRSEESLFSSKR
jgi:Family of unknown function (DUF6496)